jgi:hypothetical protein
MERNSIDTQKEAQSPAGFGGAVDSGKEHSAFRLSTGRGSIHLRGDVIARCQKEYDELIRIALDNP